MIKIALILIFLAILPTTCSQQPAEPPVVPLPDVQTDDNGMQTVNARDLWEFLESGQDFSNWIKDRIKKYEFQDGVDFVSFDKIIERETGATKRIEYHISLDMAKKKDRLTARELKNSP
jgi:phage anti-repressor protein